MTMFNTLFLALGMILVSSVTLLAQQPDLIDREIFFDDPEISGGQLSPDGQYISFLKPYEGTRNIWVKGVDETFEEARPVTADTLRPIRGYFWSRDGQYLLYVQDKGGNEDFHVYAVDPNAADQGIPEARDLTARDSTRALIYAVPKSDPDLMYVGLNDRDPAWHDLYSLRISSGELTLLRENTERITGWKFDLNDKLRLASRSAQDGSTEILRVDDEGFTKVYECGIFETCYPVRFHKNGRQVYMVTNQGDDSNLTQLVLFDPQSQEVTAVESDPEGKVDFGYAMFSDVTDEIVATFYTDEKTRRYWKDETYQQDYQFLQEKFPGKEIGLGSNTEDEKEWLVTVNSDTDPGATYYFNRDTKEVAMQYRPRPEMPLESLSEMKAISYPSSDGLEIPAYLTLPKGMEAKNLPAIIVPHGGPWARDRWGYNSYAQFLSNRGYVVLQPNFRGSTGYGKQFLNAGNKEWGQKMQDDITWGVKYLVEEGIADSTRVGILGGSYGGYATLAGLAFTPDVYAAGVSIVGPSNLITLLNSIPPYWESIYKLFTERMGDPETPEGRAQLERQSPLNSADQIETPLLVIQGANDPRVKQAESDQIVVALRERGFPVEYIVAPDEGHGFARPVNNMAMLARTEEFLAKYLDGRYQSAMKPEIAQRLEEITVDVNSVTMPQSVDVTAAVAPEPEQDLEAGSYTYQVTIEMGEQKIPMETQLEIKDEGDTWVMVESAQTPMGTATDSTVVQKQTLQPLNRRVNQGPMKMSLTYSADSVTGEMNANGQKIAIDHAVEQALFADGAGASQIIAKLPLKEDYQTTYQNLDLQSNQMKTMVLEVIGEEEVTVPAGTFKTYRVEVKPANGDAGQTEIWVDQASQKAVKSKAVIPAMSGAVMTTELKNSKAS
ncbi:MAG: S9 family peptidase [Bacteroidota bacterium]